MHFFFTGVVSFSGQKHFQWECYGQSSDSIKTAIFKRLRRLNTALRTLSEYTEFTIKNVFEHLTLAVACSVSRHHGSREVSNSECDVTWRRVKVDRYCLPVTTVHAISHVTFPAFDFSIVIYILLYVMIYIIWGSFFNFKVNIVFR